MTQQTAAILAILAVANAAAFTSVMGSLWLLHRRIDALVMVLAVRRGDG